MLFRWNEWNLAHATQHGVSAKEAEAVIRSAKAPFPEARGDGKWAVWGRGQGDRLVQVIYVIDVDGTFYVIHARPLTDIEKKRFKRRRK